MYVTRVGTSELDAQLDSIVTDFEAMRTASQHNDLSDLPKDERQSLVTRCVAAVHRISGKESHYSMEIQRLVEEHPALHLHTSSVIGVAKALRSDLRAGHLQTLVQLANAAIFADFLEMASHLLDSQYKDAAAVIVGATLESHLRELSTNRGLPIQNNGAPLKADKLNAELAKAGAYSGIDQKNVIAWLGLRNSAAHGEFAKYGSDQVRLFISGVRDFIARTPA